MDPQSHDFRAMNDPNTPEPVPSEPNRKVLSYVTKTFADILNEIQRRPFGRPAIVLRRITGLKPCFDDGDKQERWHVDDREVTYSFPGRNKDEAWRFACLGKILFEIHEAIRTGVTITKRDIYYRDPELFQRQSTVDRYVDDIAHTCQVTRTDLNVTASPKGLVAGLLGISDVMLSDCQLVPDSSADQLWNSLGQIRWVLVVEKEAVFNMLVEKKFYKNSIFGSGLLVTGKGYPDIATRRFLRACADNNTRTGLHIPIFGLFDCDPDGMNILKTYQFGSKALAQERVYTVPEMKWLGIKWEDEAVDLDYDVCATRLTERDRAKALAMLESNHLRKPDTDLGNETFRRALQHLLILNRKMEIEAVEEREGGLKRWLEEKYSQEGWF